MPEIKVPVKPFYIEYNCDEKNCKGKVNYTGKIIPGIDPKQPLLMHICNKCKTVYQFKGLPYPRQEFERLPQVKLPTV